MAQIGSPEEARRIVQLLGGRGCHVVQGVHGHQSRDARRGHQSSARTRAAGSLAISVRCHSARPWPGHRQPRTRAVHQQRLRSEPNAGPLSRPNMRDALLKVAIDGPEVQQTIREMVTNKVAMSSTLAVYELSYPDRPPLEDRVLEALAPEAREEYLTTRKETSARAAQSTMPDLFRKAQAFERAFVKAGGLLGAGVDPTGMGGALPGYGDQRNFELLIEAGLLAGGGDSDHDVERREGAARRRSPGLGRRRQARRPGRHSRESQSRRRATSATSPSCSRMASATTRRNCWPRSKVSSGSGDSREAFRAGGAGRAGGSGRAGGAGGSGGAGR